MIQFDPNIKYTLNDFKNDNVSLHNLMAVDFDEPTPSFKIKDDETGKVTEYKINTKTPLYQLSMHFIEKYGPERAPSFLFRFNAITRFIKKWESLLVEKRLILEEPYQVKEDLLKTLLKYPINVKSGIIPKKILSSF